MHIGFIASTLTVFTLAAGVTAQGTVFCDQGDKGITKDFSQQIVNSVPSGNEFGVPGRNQNFGFGTNCIGTSHTGSSYCCQVAFLNVNGDQGTVTMTANTASTGADSLGGEADGATLAGFASQILNQCWNEDGDHSGRWAGNGYQVGLSGGTC